MRDRASGWRTRVWGAPAGDLETLRQVEGWDRSRWEQARLDISEWPQRSGWSFTFITGVAATMGTVVGAVAAPSDELLVQVAAGAGGFLVGLVALWLVAFAVFAVRAPARELKAARNEIRDVRDRLQRQEAEAPKLTIGRVHIPRHVQQVGADNPSYRGPVLFGRVLRVPVTNAPGAETAKSVQALLTFMPRDREGAFSPRNPALAEWAGDELKTTIDIPGNGIPHLFDVALVANSDHPCIFQWNKQSRDADLHGYGLAGRGIITVEIRGSGAGELAPAIVDTLEIEAHAGIVRANWASRNRNEESDNWVPK